MKKNHINENDKKCLIALKKLIDTKSKIEKRKITKQFFRDNIYAR